MLGFKEWLALKNGGHTFAFFQTEDTLSKANAYYLIESGRSWQLDKQWSVRMDQPHVRNMQKHCHIMFKGNEVSVINTDGTQSHGTTRTEVPNWVVNKMKHKGWISESMLAEASSDIPTFPSELIGSVHFRAWVHDRLRQIARR